MSGHEFCRSLLADIFQDVKKRVPVKDRKKVFIGWNGDQAFLFHAPGNFVLSVSACCRYEARFLGWCEYLEHLENEK